MTACGAPPPSPWRLSVAPMLDATDRHCRVLHRLITRRTRLYTEMVTTGALLHGDVARHLDFSDVEHPLALQLGGSEPADLARAAKLGSAWGYDEINLNCGCPSERVQRGAFGACLMAEPVLVADGVAAMRDAVALPVTVKHRLGIDRRDDFGFVRDFVGTVAERGGCTVFVVHARNAWLQGVSPKDNRELPPLRHAAVARLKAEFPALTFVVNGGIAGDDQIDAQLAVVDGVMVGRAAYAEPWRMAAWDARFWGDGAAPPDRDAVQLPDHDAVEDAYVAYLSRLARAGQPWRPAVRHMLGLRHGQPGARRWRQVWSDAALRDEPPHVVQRLAARARAAAGQNPVHA